MLDDQVGGGGGRGVLGGAEVGVCNFELRLSKMTSVLSNGQFS